jgi:hypothetical protein
MIGRLNAGTNILKHACVQITNTSAIAGKRFFGGDTEEELTVFEGAVEEEAFINAEFCSKSLTEPSKLLEIDLASLKDAATLRTN